MRPRAATAAAILAAIFLAIYLPDIGHGFISDDFRWIVESRADGPGDLVDLFTTNVGFYRPLVALTFAADYALWETNAFGYGVTNLLLVIADAALLFALARRVDLPAAASLATVGVWVLNFHAVNMSLLWLSGRTALLAALFSLATANLFVSGRFVLAGLACLAAMLSKEEAVALPALFTAFERLKLTRTWPLWIALVLYLALRLPSGAFWPNDAPSFYAFTFSPALVGRNILEYADRAGTTAAVVAILFAAVTRLRRQDFATGERRVLILAALWIPAMFALTVLVPVRSSLYALLPSIGSALAAGAVASAALRTRPERFAKAAIVLLVAAAALIPVYRSRNVRWVELAELSERVMTTLEGAAAGREGGHVVLIDDLEQRFNLDAAFGSLFPEAVTLRLGSGWSGEVVARPDEATRPADLTFWLTQGSIRPLSR